MATITVRQLDDEVRRLLKVRAALHNRSMEAEVRHILTSAALDVDGQWSTARTRRPTDDPRPTLRLTEREEEVCDLVALGLSNRRIAARLYLSERTVESHVSAILRKLDFPSRSSIAHWHARRPPQS
ncbi:FitA-like ribbon-helix-helix domain-containing protein [Ornithinimicrobium cryptoxanthini]|uniref:FitA-like ribbon-helix-helix domain-containing protein n=1 Tax=Ornithinimicrobium cryptoxanthini TaxID=2934161 RepID=UPI002118E82C|nr:LuxR C-terminal-related transcriptional regulator [Ornithinimicrobium cryptoxanthini]